MADILSRPRCLKIVPPQVVVVEIFRLLGIVNTMVADVLATSVARSGVVETAYESMYDVSISIVQFNTFSLST